MTPPNFLDINVRGQIDHLVDDNSIGILSTYDPNYFPESMLVDPERLERALIAFREEFGQTKNMNVAIARGPDGDHPAVALYPDDERDRAIIVSPRYRDSDDMDDAEVAEVEQA